MKLKGSKKLNKGIKAMRKYEKEGSQERVRENEDRSIEDRTDKKRKEGIK